jgi:hypothetical protein
VEITVGPQKVWLKNMTIAAFGIYIFLKVIIREGSAARIMLPTIKPQLLICSTGIQKS